MTSIDNLVHETATSTGTGNFTLSNKDGRQSFNAAFGTGGNDVFYYFISHQSAAEWEVGTGSLSASTTLVRDTVLASSNSDAAVNFGAGTKDVTNDVPASVQPNTLLTTRGDILVRGASIPQRLAVGSSGQIVTSDGTDVAWGDAAVDLIASGTVSAAASLDITDLSADYRAYKLVFDDYVPATDATFIFIRTDTNNGASFETGASDYAWMFFGTNGNGYGDGRDQADTAMEIRLTTGGFGSGAGESAVGEITIFNPMDSGARTQVLAHVTSNNSDSNNFGSTAIMRGERLADEANNAIQILSSSGNITNMNYTLYGLRAS